MPRYDYQCAACERRFEVVHGLHDDGPTVCPLCGLGPVRKAFAPPTIHFKGSGWAKKERRAAPTSKSSDDASTERAPVAASSAGESTSNGTGGASEPGGGSKDAAAPGGTGGD